MTEEAAPATEPTPKRPRRRRRLLRVLFYGLLLGFVATNVIACLHARAMTHFVDAGERTPAPEDLGLGGKIRVLLTGVRIPRPENTRTPADLGLAFVTDPSLTIDRQTLEMWRIARPGADNRPRRGVVVALPGYAASKSSLLDYVPVFHELGFDCVLVDPRGVGGSAGSTTTIGHDEAFDAMAGFRKARWWRPEAPIVFFGFSGGAAAITRAMSTHDDLDDLVDPAALILEACFDTLLGTVKNRFHTMGLPATPFAHGLVLWGGALHGFNGFTHDPATYASQIDTPTLLLHGDRDPRVPPDAARALRDGFRGPADLHFFAGLGHQSAIAGRPDEWRHQVETFLDRVIPPLKENR